jgi:hypothetical protein
MQHTIEADIAKVAGLAYIELDGGRDRKIFRPVCHDYGHGIVAEPSYYSNESEGVVSP